MEDLTGKKLGPYKIIELLGMGGMGAVYKAYQPSLKRDIALKILTPHLAGDTTFVGRFMQEAEAAAKLEHPHILPIYDYGQSEGYHYIAMRLVKSRRTLRNLLEGQPLPLSTIRQVITQVGEALAYAHSQKVIHRDVKPANILVSTQGYYILTDFGIAKILGSSVEYTQAGASIGTAAYMSPEQIRGESLDGRSDIYSLGIVLYEMATGHTPYQGKAAPVIHKGHLADPLPPPRQQNPALPPTVEQVIIKALTKQPSQRYATAIDMVQALQNAIPMPGSKPTKPIEVPGTAIDNLSSTQHTSAPMPRVPVSPTPTPALTPPPKSKSSKKGLFIMAGAVFIVLLAIITAVVLIGVGQRMLQTTPTLNSVAVITTETATSTSTPTDTAPSPTNTTAAEVKVTPPSLTDTPMPATATHTAESVATTSPPITTESTETPTPEPELSPTTTIIVNVPAAPDISGLIAIPLMYGNEPKVYVTNTDGELQNAIGTARQPDYTADGQKLVVNGQGGSEDKLRVSDSLGNGTTQVGDMGLTEHGHPAWSPDGAQLIYDDGVIDPSGWHIFFGPAKNREGPGTELRAASGPIIGRYPLWASQDRYIFHGCNTWANKPSECGLWVMPGNNGTPTQLTNNLRHIPVDVYQDTVVYVSDEAGDWNIYTVDLTTGTPRQLTNNPAADGLPAIAPDGRSVAFISNRNGGPSVWAVDLTGGSPQKLFDVPADWGDLRADGWSEEKLSWAPKP